MLHAAALAKLEASAEFNATELWAYTYEILDPTILDSKTMDAVLLSDMRVELLFTWIQQLITEQIDLRVLCVPPPVLTRVYQQLSDGMMEFHNAMKICSVPFPFPYAQVCDWILVTHLILTPIVTSAWVTNPVWSAVMCFVQIFIVWALNNAAIEIENPYGKAQNDVDGA